MRSSRRILVTAVCYLMSSYGIVLSLILAAKSGIGSFSGAALGLVILLAWVCHLMMSIGWVLDRRSDKWVPWLGTCAGALGLMLWPVAESAIRQFTVTDVVRAVAMGLAFTFPCFVLAIHLVRFHLAPQPRQH